MCLTSGALGALGGRCVWNCSDWLRDNQDSEWFRKTKQECFSGIGILETGIVFEVTTLSHVQDRVMQDGEIC